MYFFTPKATNMETTKQKQIFTFVNCMCTVTSCIIDLSNRKLSKIYDTVLHHNYQSLTRTYIKIRGPSRLKSCPTTDQLRSFIYKMTNGCTSHTALNTVSNIHDIFSPCCLRSLNPCTQQHQLRCRPMFQLAIFGKKGLVIGKAPQFVDTRRTLMPPKGVDLS